MKRSRTVRLLAALAFAVIAFAGAAGVAPRQAFAGEVYTATVTPSYYSPITGQIEDSGGDSNAELGQSMTESATYPYALVEYDDNGAAFVTVRLQLATHISGEAFAYDANWTGSFTASSATLMQQSGDTSDFRFQVDNTDYLPAIRVQMYVADMGRDVIYFLTLDGLSEGNSQGFIESVSTGDTAAAQPAESGTAESANAAATTATPSTSAPAASAPAASTKSAKSTKSANASKTSPAAATPKSSEAETPSTEDAADTADGIAEFDKDGNEVGLFAGAPTFTVPQAVAIALAVVAGVAAVGAVVYLVGIRPRKRALADAAFAAATLDGAGAGSSTPVAPAASASASSAPAATVPAAATDKTTVLPAAAPVSSNGEEGSDR